VIANVIAPVPLPPVVVSETVEPTVPDPLATTKVVCNPATTPKVTLAVAFFKTPPIFTDAVIVNVSPNASAVGVPEITPFAVSNVSPAGRVPEIEYVAVDPTSAESDVAIGVIATPSASITDDVESAIAGLVMNVVDVTAGPAPAAFDAVTDATY
jgi:hypothetical protein